MMGGGVCGVDSAGRQIGYLFEGTCDHPGCPITINRGLAHACGDTHGVGANYCEGYFCYNHMEFGVPGVIYQLCVKCAEALEAERA